MKFKVGDKVRWGTDPDDRKWVGEVTAIIPRMVSDGMYYFPSTTEFLYRVRWPEESGWDWDDYDPAELDLVVVPTNVTVKPKGESYPRWTITPVRGNPLFDWAVLKVREGSDPTVRTDPILRHRCKTLLSAQQQLEDMVRAHFGLEPLS